MIAVLHISRSSVLYSFKLINVFSLYMGPILWMHTPQLVLPTFCRLVISTAGHLLVNFVSGILGFCWLY